MASQLESKPTTIQHIQPKRFTTEQHGYQLEDISISLSGKIAVSGSKGSDRSFIDLFSRSNSDSGVKFKSFHSIVFKDNPSSVLRLVLFLEKDCSKILTCVGNLIEIFDTRNKCKVLRSCKVEGLTNCIAVREGEIFVGLQKSQTVIVSNNNLKITNTILIKGLQFLDFPCDLQVLKNVVFVCTVFGRALSIALFDGSTITEYTDNTGTYSKAWSITVSMRLDLVVVVWSGNRIIVYSLIEIKSLLVFEVDSAVFKIRISDRDSMMITGNRNTGEIKMYELEQVFSFEAMKRTLAYIVSPGECEELRKCFAVTEEELIRKENCDEDNSKNLSEKEKLIKKMDCLLTIIEEKGYLNPCNINNLTVAVSSLDDEIRISHLKGPMERYALHGMTMKNLMAELMIRQKAWEDERNQLSTKLETANTKVKKMDNMKKSVRCSICLEVWTRPKTLPCDHVFCETCLEQIVIRSPQVVKCPECRQEHILPPQGFLNSWFTNRYLNSLADDFKKLEDGT